MEVGQIRSADIYSCRTHTYTFQQKGRKKSIHTAKIVDSDEDSESKLGDIPDGEDWKALYTVKIATSNEELKTSGSGDGVVKGEGEGPNDSAGLEGGTVGGAMDDGRGHNKDRRGSKRKKKKTKKEGQCHTLALEWWFP